MLNEGMMHVQQCYYIMCIAMCKQCYPFFVSLFFSSFILNRNPRFLKVCEWELPKSAQSRWTLVGAARGHR